MINTLNIKLLSFSYDPITNGLQYRHLSKKNNKLKITIIFKIFRKLNRLFGKMSNGNFYDRLFGYFFDRKCRCCDRDIILYHLGTDVNNFFSCGKQVLNQNGSDPKKCQNRTYLHTLKFEDIPDIQPKIPTTDDLNIFAHELNDILYEYTSKRYIGNDERNYETVAIGFDEQNKTFLVATNIKERITTIEEKIVDNDYVLEARDSYGDYGIMPDHVAEIFRMKEYFDEKLQFNTTIITTEQRPQNAQENAASHAEMQILSYARENGNKINKIGISKPPCACCKQVLDQKVVQNYHLNKGNQNPKNWKTPKEIKTIAYARKVEKEQSKFKWNFKKNISSSSESKKNIKKHLEVKSSFDCTISNGTVLNVIDNIDRPLSLRNDLRYGNIGTYSSDRTLRKGVYARAGYCETSMSKSLVDVRFSLLTASANAEINAAGISAGINAILFNVQINFGVLTLSYGMKASTGFSVGADGIEAQFLGNGFSFGPKKIFLKTTYFEIGINPNALVGALLAAIYHFSKMDIDPEFHDIFDELINFIKNEFFGGKPPPPPPAEAMYRNNISKNKTETKVQITVQPQIYQTFTNDVVDSVQNVANSVVNVAQNVTNGVGDIVQNVTDGVVDIVHNVENFLSGLFNRNEPRMMLRY